MDVSYSQHPLPEIGQSGPAPELPLGAWLCLDVAYWRLDRTIGKSAISSLGQGRVVRFLGFTELSVEHFGRTRRAEPSSTTRSSLSRKLLHTGPQLKSCQEDGVRWDRRLRDARGDKALDGHKKWPAKWSSREQHFGDAFSTQSKEARRGSI